jgi:hypothetical protein
MECGTVEAVPGNADRRRDRSQHIGAGRHEVEMIGVLDDMIFRRGRQCDADGFGVIRMRQDVVLGGAPERIGTVTFFRPSRPNEYPTAGATTTAALMRGSRTQLEAAGFERTSASISALASSLARLNNCAS